MTKEVSVAPAASGMTATEWVAANAVSLRARLDELVDQLAAVELDDLPGSVVSAVATVNSNGDGVGPSEFAVRLLALKSRGVIDGETYRHLVLAHALGRIALRR